MSTESATPHVCSICHINTKFHIVSISGSAAQDLETTYSSSFRTHLPRGPGTRVGRGRPRVETGDRLSRIGRGKAHALIGGKIVRSLAIVSRGGHRQLQKQRPGAQQMDGKHRRTGSTIGSQEESREREGRREKREKS